MIRHKDGLVIAKSGDVSTKVDSGDICSSDNGVNTGNLFCPAYIQLADTRICVRASQRTTREHAGQYEVIAKECTPDSLLHKVRVGNGFPDKCCIRLVKRHFDLLEKILFSL